MPGAEYRTDEDKLGLAIELSRTNLDGKAAGPFGAAIFVAGGSHPIVFAALREDAERVGFGAIYG